MGGGPNLVAESEPIDILWGGVPFGGSGSEGPRCQPLKGSEHQPKDATFWESRQPPKKNGGSPLVQETSMIQVVPRQAVAEVSKKEPL